MLKLAARMGRAKPSAIMLIADKAKQLKAAGRDIVNFSIGVPNFLPGEHVYAAVREALRHDSGAYGSNRGRDDLLDAFLAHMREIGLDGYARANVAVGIGAKQVLYNLCEALLDEGDEIVFPTPYWTSYLDIAEILGAKITLLPCPSEQNYKLTPAQLDAALAKKPNAKGQALLKQARDLAYSPIVGASLAADKSFLALFTANKKDAGANKQVTALEDRWNAQALDHYQRAKALAEQALATAR